MCVFKKQKNSLLSDSLGELLKHKKQLQFLAEASLKADKGNVFVMDIMTQAVINRSLELADGFKMLMEKEQFLCAAPILRLQVDNLLRYSAVWLVENPHDFCREVLKGTPMSKLKDALGNYLKDWYLVEVLSKDIKWIRSVYKKTCGFVHLSEEHFHKILVSGSNNGTFTLGIAEYSKPVPLSAQIETVDAFNAVTVELMRHIKGWIQTKDCGGEKEYS